jgi:hypothetical protein
MQDFGPLNDLCPTEMLLLTLSFFPSASAPASVQFSSATCIQVLGWSFAFCFALSLAGLLNMVRQDFQFPLSLIRIRRALSRA